MLNKSVPIGMCYSHFGNGAINGAIYFIQRGYINYYYKVTGIDQWIKENHDYCIMGFAHIVGQWLRSLPQYHAIHFNTFEIFFYLQALLRMSDDCLMTV